MGYRSEKKNVKGRQIGTKKELGLLLAELNFKHTHNL